MKNIWSLVCTKAIIDQMTNSLTLLDVVDEVTVTFTKSEDLEKKEKNVSVNLAVVNLWYDGNTETERQLSYLVEVFDPSVVKVAQFDVKAKFEQGKKRLRTIVNIGGLKLNQEGVYNFQVSYRDENDKQVSVAQIPIDFKFVLNLTTKPNN